MSDYQIVTDSTTDLSPEMVKDLELHIIPMIFNIGGKDYRNTPDYQDLGCHEFYEMVRGGQVSLTTQINGETFKDEVRPFLEKGLDILHLSFSSGLSSTYSSISIAAGDLREEYPDRKIIIIDTLSESMGEGLVAYHAAKRRQQGQTIEEVAKWVEDNKLHMAHWFTVDDLSCLKRGGRLSPASAFFATVLNVKPVLHSDDEGKLVAMEKIRGRKKSLDCLVDHMEKTAIDPAGQVVFISHADALEDAQYVEQQIRSRLGVKTVYINPIGPVIGGHSGPSTIALFFLATKR